MSATRTDGATKDILVRLREWKRGQWPKDRLLDDDIADAALEIDSLRLQLSECRSCFREFVSLNRPDLK